MMILESLEFRRPHSYEKSINPMVGSAKFKDANGTAELNLTTDEINQILVICAANLHKAMTARTEAMKASLQQATLSIKAIEIGKSLPAEFA